MKLHSSAYAAIGIGIALGIPTSGVQAQTAPQSSSQSAYKIGPGDTIQVLVFEKPELSRNIVVPPDGKITYTFLGELQVSGKSIEEVRLMLTEGLKKQLLNPIVTVELSTRVKPEVSVLGAVRQSGKQPLQDGMRLLELVATCGGLTVNRPEWVTATVVRTGGRKVVIDMIKLMTGDEQQNILLEPNDVILFREVDIRSFSMMLIGECKKTGMVEVPKSGSMLEIVQSVGGFNPKASLGNARLTRDGKTVTLDLRSVLADGTVKVIGDGKGVINPASPTVKPGDVLMVDTYETVFTAWGGVNRPGRIEFPESGQLSVVDALVLAGGPGQFADLKNAAILRPKDGSNDWDTVYVDLQGLVKTPDPKAANKKPDKNAPAAPVKPGGAELTLRPNDILFIPVKDPDNRKSFGLRDAMQMFMFGGFLLR